MNRRKSQNDEQLLPAEIGALFARYREAVPDSDPGAAFMPGLWAKIDARRGVVHSFRRLVRGFVTASAALCILLSAGMYSVSQLAPPTVSSSSYIEVLDDHEAEADGFEFELARLESR